MRWISRSNFASDVAGSEGLPVGRQRHLPRPAFGRGRLAHQIVVSRLVRRHQACLGARLDGQVAQGHAPFHGKAPHRRAGVFDHIAGAARRADLADDGQRNILGPDAGRKLSVDHNAHVLGLALAQGLRGQHMLDLRRADAVGQGPERAVGRGVAIAADNGHARLGAALLGPDHVDDAVADIAHGEELDAVGRHIAPQRLQLQARLRIGHRAHPAPLTFGRHIVVGHRQGAVGPSHRPAVGAQARERLRAGHLVDQVQVDIEDAFAVRIVRDDVGIPDLVIKGLGHGRDVVLWPPQSPEPALKQARSAASANRNIGAGILCAKVAASAVRCGSGLRASL